MSFRHTSMLLKSRSKTELIFHQWTTKHLIYLDVCSEQFESRTSATKPQSKRHIWDWNGPKSTDYLRSKSLPKGLEHDQYSSEDLQKHTLNVLDASCHGPQGISLSTGAFERKKANADLYRPKATLKDHRPKRQILGFKCPKKSIYHRIREPDTMVNDKVSAKDPAVTRFGATASAASTTIPSCI